VILRILENLGIFVCGALAGYWFSLGKVARKIEDSERLVATLIKEAQEARRRELERRGIRTE
jgi:hypothetical protein